VVRDATFRFPFGYQERLVLTEAVGGTAQRPFTD